MVQALCYTGKAFNMHWRPGNIAARIAVMTPYDAPFTAIRFYRG